MANKQIVDYLKRGIKKGFSEKKLKDKLLEVGWTKPQINEALKEIPKKPPESKSQKKESPPKRGFQRKTKKKDTKTLVEKNKNKTNNALLYILIPVLVIAIIVLLFFMLPQKISHEELSNGTYENIKEGKSKKFSIGEKEHELTVTSVQDDEVEVEIRSNVTKVELTVGETRKIDLDDDNYYELELRAEKTEGDEAEIYIKEINQKICTPEWECTVWSPCDGGRKVRDCTDQNNCGVDTNKPRERKECEETCEENWTCTDWSECTNGTQTRNCTDENNCGSDSNKPETEKECEVEVLKNCSELNGTLCNSSSICNGTTLNSSDDSVCCDVGCVLNISEETSNFTEQAKEYCEEERDMIYFDNKTEYCTDAIGSYSPVLTGLNETVTCCGGNIFPKYNFSGEPKNTWESLENKGSCNVSLANAFENCSEYKCGSVNKSVLGIFNEKCHYYEQMPDNAYFYCKFNETMQQKMSDCYTNYYVNEDSMACDTELNNALDKGICQMIGIS